MRKKICMLIMPALFSGGAEKQYRYIMEAASDSENKVIVLLLNVPAQSEKTMTMQFIKEHPNIEFHQLDGRVMSIGKKKRLVIKYEKLRTLFMQRKWVKKFIKNNIVDVVMFSYVTQLLLVPVLKKKNIKVIFNERNTGRQICDKKFKIELLKRCDKVIANSSYAAQYIKDKTGIEVSVINNGIENKRLERKKHSGFNILVPARVTRIKNQMLIVKSLQYLNDIELNVYLAGSVEDEAYYCELKDEAKRLGVQKKVEFCGYIKDMTQIYSITNLLILPSFEEGTPNVLLEAYLYGIPAIASDIPMNRDCVVNAEMLFNPDRAEELARKVRYITKEIKPEVMEAICKDNLAFVEENYSMRALKKNYDALLFS